MPEQWRPAPEEEKKEHLEKDEWVLLKHSPRDIAKLVEDEVYRALTEQGYVYGHRSVRQLAGWNVSDKFNSIFKNGLKDSKSDLERSFKPCEFRFVDVPEKIAKDESVMYPVAFEISAHLTPRYQKDGEAGYYTLKFIVYAKENDNPPQVYRNMMKPGQKFAYVSFSTDSYSRKRAAKEADKARELSVESWRWAVTEALAKAISGGAPGLGKRQ